MKYALIAAALIFGLSSSAWALSQPDVQAFPKGCTTGCTHYLLHYPEPRPNHRYSQDGYFTTVTAIPNNRTDPPAPDQATAKKIADARAIIDMQ